MRAIFFVFSWVCVCLLDAKESRELKNNWGGNACTLPKGLVVESNPAHIQITTDKCDQFVQKEQFKDAPTVKYPDAKSGESYTLVMVDPDAPNHPGSKYYLHWLVDNIPGDDIKSGNMKNGRVISSYVGPAPPQATGVHRYMLMLYRQVDAAPAPAPASPNRPQFDLAGWLGVKVCGPVAGLQFRTNFSGKQ